MTPNDARLLVLKALMQTEIIDQAELDAMNASPESEIKLAELNIDSMKVIDLCNALEEMLGREVEVEELVENSSVNALARHFAKSGSLKSAVA